MSLLPSGETPVCFDLNFSSAVISLLLGDTGLSQAFMGLAKGKLIWPFISVHCYLFSDLNKYLQFFILFLYKNNAVFFIKGTLQITSALGPQILDPLW